MKISKSFTNIFLLYLFFCRVGIATEKPLIFLQIQESQSRGTEQTSLVFFRDRVELTTNTNRFIAEAVRQPINKAHLGAFRPNNSKKWAEQLKELLVLKERSLRQKVSRNQSAHKQFAMSVSPHEVRISLDGEKLVGGGIEFQEAWRILALVAINTEWENEDGLTVDFDPKGNIRVDHRKGKLGRGIPPKELEKCKNDILNPNAVCEITKLGVIHGYWLRHPKI